MHKIYSTALASVFVLFAGAAVAAAARTPDQTAALASFQAMLDGLAQRDAAAMSKHLLPGGHATLMRDSKPLQLSFEELAARLSTPGPEAHQERIHSAWVQVDHNIAVIWAPFEFLIDGKVNHCGRDLVNLVRVEGQWLISAISDYSQTNCNRSTP